MRFTNNMWFSKKMTLLVLLSFLCTLSGTGPVMAQAGRVTGEKANVRATPGLDGDLVGTLPQNYLVQIIQLQGEWYQISSDQYAGWIRSDLMAPTEDASYLEITGDPVNLRSGPGTEYNALGQAHRGFTVLMIGQQGDWYQGITPSGTVVYVRSDMARVTGPGSANQADTPPVAAPGDSVSEGGCKVYLNGVQLSFDVQPCVENDRLLVPVRVIFESAGATVTYDPSNQTVYARRGDSTITLPLNSTFPIVNGKIWTIDVPARVIDNRTLVPLRFAGEAMGGTVSWDEANQTAMISIPDVNVPADHPGSDNEPAPNTPVDPLPSANQGLEMSISRDRSGLNLTMQAGQAVEVEIDEDSGKVSYEFEGVSMGAQNVIREALGSAGTLQASGRNEGQDAVIEVTWPAGIDYDTRELDNGRGYVFTIPNFVTGVGREKYGTVGERLMIDTLCPVEYSSSQDDGEVELTLKNISQGLAAGSYSFDDYLLESLKVSESGSATKTTRLNIETSNVGRVSFTVTGADDNTLNMILIDESKLWPPGTTSGPIILDPGHGGSDGGTPGSVSNEKDINLAIALKVRDVLEGQGINVEMTRDDDYYMGLVDRSDLANAVNGSLFVSIHANSSDDNPAARGTETYFYAPLNSPDLYAQRVEREALASAIQDKLIFYCGTTDRGVKEDNLAVLRETNMPSALTELAFVSNVADETLLNTPAFQQMAARAIADGIVKYIND